MKKIRKIPSRKLMREKIRNELFVIELITLLLDKMF